MFKVGDLVTLGSKMCKIFGLEEATLIGVVTRVLKPLPNHIINQAYVINWINESESYPPGMLPPNVLHGFADIEQDIIFYEHELCHLSDLVQKEEENKK